MRIARSKGPVLGIVLTGMAMVAVAQPVSAASTTRWVATDGKAGPSSCDGTRKASKTIQGAIKASGSGDRIVVCTGTYREALSVSGAAKAGLTIKAAKPGKAILRTPAAIAGPVVEIADTSAVTISGLAVRVDTAAPCARVTDAIRVAGSDHVVLAGITIGPRGTATFGDCGYEVGVHVTTSDPVTIKSPAFTDFQINGILMEGSSTATVASPTLRFLHATAPAGSYCAGEGIRAESSTLTVTGGIVRAGSGAATSTPCLAAGIVTVNTDTAVTGTSVRYALFGIILSLDGTHALTDVTVTDGRGPLVGNGIDLRAATGTVTRATVTGMSGQGISLSGAAGSTVVDGDFRGNAGIDCWEAPGPSIWTNNLGDESSPSGLCSAS